jgi:hypothetical protein
MVEGTGKYQEYSLEAAAAILFGPLREAERRLLRAVPMGERAFAGPEGENNPEHAEQWEEEREVRVALLRWLCIDPSAQAVVGPEGVRLAGARFDDRLVLSFVTVRFPLRLAACHFPKGIAIEGASLPSLVLMRCWIKPPPSSGAAEATVMASNLTVSGSLTLDGTHSFGELRLFGAEIGKTLNCEGASFRNAGRIALNCERAKIGGVALLRNGFTSEGELRFEGTQITGDLNCDGASLKNADGRTLQCIGSNIGGSVYLRTRVSSEGEVNRFSSEGEVNLVRCQIGGNLECDGASFKNASGRALNGELVNRRALNCEAAKIGGAALLRNGFASEGEVRFFNATVGGLECNGASFKNAPRPALNCEAARIGGILRLRNGIAAQGEVRLFGTQIGHLDVEDVDLSVEDGGSLVVRLAEIKGEFRIGGLTCGPDTIVDLRGASCDLFADDPSACPEQGNLGLDGFVYRRLTNPGAAKARLRWVRCPLPEDVADRRGTFRPQPYRLLAQTLRAQGDENDARWFLIRMAEDRRKYAQLGWPTRFWTWLLWHVMRNGYRPLQVILWLLVLWIVSGVVFETGYELGLMAPTDEKAFNFIAKHGSPPPWYPAFRAPVYAIDISLPIISLGLRDKWQPLVQPAPVGPGWPTTTGFSSWLGFLEPRAAGIGLTIWHWIAIVLGWFLASMLVAGVTGLVARE